MSDELFERYGGWALVTGASSGLGASYAESLAAAGFPLILTARRQDRMDELAARLSAAHGTKSLVVPLDLAVPGACDQLIEAAGDREVGVLVNNAGFGFSGAFVNADTAADERMVQLNCSVPVRLTHACLPAMRERGRGAILILSSVAGFQPTPWFTVYGATKAFDLVFAEALWSELRGSGVDVLAVCPGETRTEFARHAHMGRDSGGMEPDVVVVGSLAKLGRGPTFVPGAKNKFAAFLSRFFPRSFVATATGNVLARELVGKTPDELRNS